MTINTKILQLAAQAHRDVDAYATADLLRDAAGEIDAQAAEIARLREALRKIESVGGDATSGDGHARCKQIARAALSGGSK